MKGLVYGLIFYTAIIQYGHATLFQRPPDSKIHFPRNEFAKPINQSDLIDTVNTFCWNIFHDSKLPNVSSNLILSPIMIQLLLFIIEKASSGETQKQIRQVIGPFTSQDLTELLIAKIQSQAKTEVANGLFVDGVDNLNQTFVDYAKLANVVVQPVQFNRGEVTKNIINKWASDATHGFVPKLLSDNYDVQDLQMVLGSAIYFHSTWKYRFSNIEDMPFYTENGRGQQVKFMELKQELVWEELIVDHKITGSLIEIPYENDAYSMVVVLPDKQYSLDTFIRSMTSDHFRSISQSIFTNKPKYLTLKMPKFEASSQFSVVNSLLKMGLVDLFTTLSNLPYIGLNANPKISDILQQAVLKIDEDGTTAAAATASLLIPLSAGSEDDRTMTVDRPFLAIIFDRSNRIPLFIGKVYQP